MNKNNKQEKNDILESKNTIEDSNIMENFSTNLLYKNNIGKLLPLSYVVTEIENYFEKNKTGDFIVLISRDSFSELEEKSEHGIKLVYIRSNNGNEFVVFYKAKCNQFGLFYRKQITKDTFKYYLINSWSLRIEDDEWYDTTVENIKSL